MEGTLEIETGNRRDLAENVDGKSWTPGLFLEP